MTSLKDDTNEVPIEETNAIDSDDDDDDQGLNEEPFPNIELGNGHEQIFLSDDDTEEKENSDNGIIESDVLDIALENVVGSESEEINLHDDANEYEIRENDNQIFNEELNKDDESDSALVNEPEEIVVFEDDQEEKDSSSSGIGESDISDFEVNSVIPPPVIQKPVRSVGRGQNNKIPVDEYNQPILSPAIIREVEPEKGYYWESARKAILPISYYRKQEDQKTKNQRLALRRSSPLIDFEVKFIEIFFIIDKDDSKEQGLQHAYRLLQQICPDLKIDLKKIPHDEWSFGLYIYQIKLEESILCSLLKLFPEKIDNEQNRPFWFMFKRLPAFQDSKLRDRISKKPDEPKGTSILINRATYADLSYGALTSMSHFNAHKDYVYRKRIRWSLYFHNEFFEIQTMARQGLNKDGQANLIQIRYKILPDIIDRAAIIHLWNDGFSLFLNMKGNVHELYRDYKKRETTDAKNFDPFIRQGIRNGKVMPLFSTIRLRIRLNDDQAIADILEREGKISKTTSVDEKNGLITDTREESLNAIRDMFKNFLDFFSNNRIHICFGPISQRLASLEQINSLNYRRFPTFIQSYSWAILCNIGFRVQIKISNSKTFIKQLYDYSLMTDDEKQEENSSQIDNGNIAFSKTDERFYRLCLYLHRRSLEYFFLNLDEEIKIGIEEYNAKYKELKKSKPKKPDFNPRPSSTAYIPSVVLTPTTIKIRPLKLCKLNRVLREKKFGSVLNFALIELRDEAQSLLFATEFRSLKDQILQYLTDGFDLTPDRRYKYLHHSQSQVKCKRFWFYHHDKTNLTHEAAYIWMGNFDKERVVAKHAARIALCFTSTDPTIQIPADRVTYIRDIKDVKKQYTFTDGVGTISSSLRDQIMNFLDRRYEFSVLQIRYGGCKGTLSVDPRLDDQQYQLIIRDSMNKFTTDHDILEVCKLSAPRALYLNRQDIVLLESRNIPHTNFLNLQNIDHLRLVHALLKPEIAYELLQEKLLPIFKLRNIAQNLNVIEEQFFIKLIITCAFNIMRELIDRTRICISDMKARNMFGIVDEYGVLEDGQVFFQYTTMSNEKSKLFNKEEGEEEEEGEGEEEGNEGAEVCSYEGKVVLTKNPCHHPGDLRVFDAIYHPSLKHLKDVIVFPQKGVRPHSNQISGSDLDGDEYVVIWHEHLIPNTPNEEAYDYDSQEDSPKMDRPITREDINKVVMEVSEQDCLGTLSNIHLAYADKLGIKSEICTRLAGHISQEVGAAKTGKHPLTTEVIKDLRDGLNKQWPDFMKSRGKKEFYPSKRILGKLYRSARRSVVGWSRAISNHGNPRHINLALALATGGTDTKEEENDKIIVKKNTLLYYEYPLDPDIFHPDYEKYLTKIKYLYKIYQNKLLEIISLYRVQDEIDLFCRCESMDASAFGNKKGSLEDSASIEIQNLVEKITQMFYAEFHERRKIAQCCKYIEKPVHDGLRWKRINCDYCREGVLAKAACAYIHCYTQSNRLPLKSNRRILSFPWLFAGSLIRLRYRNQKGKIIIDQINTITGRACFLYLENFIPKFKVFIPANFIGIPQVEFFYRKNEEKRTSLLPTNKKPDEKICFVRLLRACFVEILNDWLTKQGIFGNECIETEPKPLIPENIWHELLIKFLSYEYHSNVRLIFASKEQNYLTERYRQAIEKYRSTWTKTEYEQLQDMFDEIHAIASQLAIETKTTIWSYLDEYIISALQCIAIEKQLVDHWIDLPNSV